MKKNVVAKKPVPGPSDRAHVYYAGRVQGVGFRHTAEAVAHRIGGVHGFVKNLHDGRVEMVCEGPKEKIEQVLEGIRAELGRHVLKENCAWEPPSGSFTDFTVEFDY